MLRTPAQRILFSTIIGAIMLAAIATYAANRLFGATGAPTPNVASARARAPASPAWLASHARVRHKGTAPVEGGQEPVDFDHPFVDGQSVPDAAAADPLLTFPAIAPKAIGSPASVVVHKDFAPQAVAIVYNNATYGHFYVIEEPASETESDLQRLAKGCQASTGCDGSWKTVAMADGARALLISTTDAVTTVMWLHGIAEFVLTGPPTLAPDDALALANVFEGAATF
jgi:hypothetical protein